MPRLITGLQAVSPDRLRRARLRGVAVLRLHTNAQSRAQGAQRSGLAGREVAAVCAVLRRRRSPPSSAHSPASRGGNLPKYLYSSEAHARRRRDYEKRQALGCSQGSTHRQARYQLRPSAAFAQVIEYAGTCITRRLQEGTNTGLRAGKCPPTGQVPAAALGGLRAGAWYTSTCVC